jgi:hypothetical protein
MELPAQDRQSSLDLGKGIETLITTGVKEERANIQSGAPFNSVPFLSSFAKH